MKFLKLLVPALLLGGIFLINTSSTSKIEKPGNVNHDAWTQLLKKHVTNIGKIDYKGFQQDSVKLNEYLDQLTKHSPVGENWSNNEKIAYWINAYNAFTIKLIIRHYPVESIKKLTPKGVKIPRLNSPWTIKFFKIGNEEFNLDMIENNVLIKQYPDPRILLAIVKAAKSSPRLLNEAYVAEKLEAQLDAQAAYFINNENMNYVSAKRADISEIFKWNKALFCRDSNQKVGNDQLIDFLNKYAKNKVEYGSPITYNTFDWALNE